MDAGKKAYRIHIATDKGNAFVICVSYPLDASGSFYGLDFYELIWSSDLPMQSIPSSRQATFKEELRALHTAHSTRDSTSDELQVIPNLMRDVYGNNSIISMSPINESLQTGEL